MFPEIESPEPPSLITLLPDDIVLDILARVPRCEYPTLSLVSKHFQSLAVSPEIYARRSLLRCTENYLYASIMFDWRDPNCNRWHILSQKANGNRRFVPISSLLEFPSCESFVAVGSRIYAFSGADATSVFSIDCRYHTMQTLPNMPIPMNRTVAAFMDGNIYVFGSCSMKSSKVMVVFNTETQMWEHGLIKPDITPGEPWEYGCVVVMADKIYIRYNLNSFIYVPKESKWETDEMLNSKDWDNNLCVVDDVLYYYDFHEDCLRGYDPKQKCWEVVNGLEEFWAEARRPCWSDTASFGRKLTFSFHKREEEMRLWCAEISLERRQGGEIWGKVEWCDQVLDELFNFAIHIHVMV